MKATNEITFNKNKIKHLKIKELNKNQIIVNKIEMNYSLDYYFIGYFSMKLTLIMRLISVKPYREVI